MMTMDKGGQMKKDVCQKIGRNWLKGTLFLLAIVGLLFIGGCAKKIRTDYPGLERSGDQTNGQSGSQDSGQDAAGGGSKLSEDGLSDASPGSGIDGQSGAAMTARQKFESDDILFEYDSAALLPDAQSLLMEKAEWLQNHPGVSVIIEGHTDERGTVAYNLALGDRRAESVRSFLLDLGVDTSRIRTISYGEENPIDPGENEAAWARNRRAHFFIEK